MLPLNFFEEIFSFEGARPEKVLKIWPFSKMSNADILLSSEKSYHKNFYFKNAK